MTPPIKAHQGREVICDTSPEALPIINHRVNTTIALVVKETSAASNGLPTVAATKELIGGCREIQAPIISARAMNK